MEGVRSDFARGFSSSHGSGEAADAASKGKKIRAASPVLVSKGREAAGTEPRSAWTGEKKTKIVESTHASGDLGDIAQVDTDHSSSEVAHGQEQIEGLDWDMDKLRKEIDCYLGRLHYGPPDDCDDEGFWALNNEEELTALNQRLALCRIRAREEEYRKLDDATLAAIFPPSVLKENGYYKHYELGLAWYFDSDCCLLSRFQDYQRLMLHDIGEFEEFEYYHENMCTLEADQEFIQFWEQLSSKTKLIELYQTDTSGEPRIANLVLYHALKIATGLPNVYKNLIVSSFTDFMSKIRKEGTLYKMYADFLSEMLELVANQKMNFKEALGYVYNKCNYPVLFPHESTFDENLILMEPAVKPCLDRVIEKAQEGDVQKLIMDAVREIFIWKRMTYYDYAKKKLGIAKEIGLIPLNP